MQAPLVSMGRICDTGHTATFDATSVVVKNIETGKTVLTGKRDDQTRLWMFPLQTSDDLSDPPSLDDTDDAPMMFPIQPSPDLSDFCPLALVDLATLSVSNVPTEGLDLSLHSANSAYDQSSKRDLAIFLHGCAGFPVKSTWITAIENGHYSSWPGLTVELVKKHLPKSAETVLGHLHRQRQGVRSTTKVAPPLPPELPPRPVRSHIDRKQDVGTFVVDLNGQIATDLPGRFPVTSSRGMKYVFLLYNYDSNAILVTPMKNRTQQEFVRCYDLLHARLKNSGVVPVLQRLDNEASAALIRAIEEKQIDYQLASPNSHRHNPAERAIQTFKNHFISTLAGCDREFPVHLWCRLLPQCEMTLNMLRISRINPKLSAYSQIDGIFDFNRTPLAPLGMKAIVHERTSQRAAWASHGQRGFNIGPALHHYRHYSIFVIGTGGPAFPTPSNSSQFYLTCQLQQTELSMPLET